MLLVAGPEGAGSSDCWRSAGWGGVEAAGRFEHGGWHCNPVDLLAVQMTSGLHDSLIPLDLRPVLGRYFLH